MFIDTPFVYIKNTNVPKIEPCGTPYTILMSEVVDLYCVKFLLPSWVISENCEMLDLNKKSCYLCYHKNLIFQEYLMVQNIINFCKAKKFSCYL